MNSIGSISSVFDRYSHEYINSAHTTFDFNHKSQIFEVNAPTEKIYSKYEPVNYLLSTLYNSKYTLNKLGSNKDDITLSYREYWKIDEEKYEILRMLEPELLSKQTEVFQVYHNIKHLSQEVEQCMRDTLPSFINQMDIKKKSQIYGAFKTLSTTMSTLSYELKYMIQSSIVVNIPVFTSMVLSEFETLEQSEEFTSGIANFCNNHPAQSSTLAFKISMFNAVIPSLALQSELVLVRQCSQRITQTIDEKRKHYDFLQTLTYLPTILILVPFVSIFCFIFSIKGFAKRFV